MSAKSTKMFWPTSSYFRTYFQRIGLFSSEWAYFLRSKDKVNFTKAFFFKTKLRAHV